MKELDWIAGFPALFLSTQGVVHRSGKRERGVCGSTAAALIIEIPENVF